MVMISMMRRYDAMKKKFEATENEAKKLLSEMKTESDRKYLWENSKDLDTKSADMTRTYRNIEKIAEAMRHKDTKLKTDENKKKVKDALKLAGIKMHMENHKKVAH